MHPQGSAPYRALHGALWVYFGVTRPLTWRLLKGAEGRLKAMGESGGDFGGAIEWAGGVPQLHLYSIDDPVAAPEVVDDCIARYERNGVDVTKQCWAKSGHVKHIVYHTDEYITHVRRFLVKVGVEPTHCPPAAMPPSAEAGDPAADGRPVEAAAARL